MTFITFLLEKIYEISDKEEKDIQKLVNKYKDLFFKDSQTKLKILKETPIEYFKEELDENDRLFLGDIKIKDLKSKKNKTVNLFIDFTKGHNNRGEFVDDTEEILLYYYPMGFSLDTISDVITHEVLHAKQHYKKTSDKYKKATKKRKLPNGASTFRSNRDYFFDPVEFPVYVTLIIKQLFKEYKHSNQMERVKLKSFLKNFIKSGAKPVINNRTPDIIHSKYDFLKFVYRNRKNKKYREQYKSFIKKLFWLYSMLE